MSVQQTYDWMYEEEQIEVEARLIPDLASEDLQAISNLPPNAQDLAWYRIDTDWYNMPFLFTYDQKNKIAYWVVSECCHQEGPDYIGDILTFMQAKLLEIYHMNDNPDTLPLAVDQATPVQDTLDESLDHIDQDTPVVTLDSVDQATLAETQEPDTLDQATPDEVPDIATPLETQDENSGQATLSQTHELQDPDESVAQDAAEVMEDQTIITGDSVDTVEQPLDLKTARPSKPKRRK